MRPPAVMDNLKKFDIEIFALTDHNGIANSRAFMSAAKRAGLLFVPGIELQTAEEIHLLGYFPTIKDLESFHGDIVAPSLTPGKNDPGMFGKQIITDANGKDKGHYPGLLSLPLVLDLNTLIERVREYNGVPVPAHLDKNFSIISQLGFLPPDLKVSALEFYRLKEYQRSKDILGGFEGVVLSSSDAHHPDHMIKPKMKFRLPRFTVEDVLKTIRGEGEGKITLDLYA